MENSAPGVTGSNAEKTPDQIERDMERTRDSITEKVAALETQVMGTIQNATDTVTDTVQAVKDAVGQVSSAPGMVSDTVRQTVASVKESVMDSVKETFSSFKVSECVQNNPLAALGTSTAAGFLAGFFLSSGRRPLMAGGTDVPHSAPPLGSYPTRATFAVPEHASSQGIFGELFAMVGKEVRELAEQALSTTLASLKQSIGTQVPQMVDAAVHRVTDHVAAAGNGAGRTGGPNYAARS